MFDGTTEVLTPNVDGHYRKVRSAADWRKRLPPLAEGDQGDGCGHGHCKRCAGDALGHFFGLLLKSWRVPPGPNSSHGHYHINLISEQGASMVKEGLTIPVARIPSIDRQSSSVESIQLQR